MNRKSVAREVAFLGIMLALVFEFLLIETEVFTVIGIFGALTPAVLTIPLSIAISLSGGKNRMFFGGTLLGFSSFFLAIIIANPIFINPLVSILPRVFIGVISYLVFLGTSKLFSKSNNTFVNHVLPCSLAGMAGVLTNTTLTMTMLWVFNHTTLAALFSTILSVNFVLEVVGGAILVPVFVKAIKSAERRGKRQ